MDPLQEAWIALLEASKEHGGKLAFESVIVSRDEHAALENKLEAAAKEYARLSWERLATSPFPAPARARSTSAERHPWTRTEARQLDAQLADVQRRERVLNSREQRLYCRHWHNIERFDLLIENPRALAKLLRIYDRLKTVSD